MIIDITEKVTERLNGQRCDQIAANLFPSYSRSQIQNWIKSGELLVDKQTVKAKEKLFCGQCIQLKASFATTEFYEPQDLPLDMVFEDEHIIVLNKAAGMVTHPGAGNHDGTLLNALLYHNKNARQLARGGIVHRLDKDTSGIMVAAKTPEAQFALVKQLQARTVKREYLCLVHGDVRGKGRIDQPIGRHPKVRVKMAVLASGKPAVTHFQVRQRFANVCFVKVQLETGRTHQIRVHLAHESHPLVGDVVYGKKTLKKEAFSEEQHHLISEFPRQALHAEKLTLQHPVSGKTMSWHVPMPQDMTALVTALRLL